MNPTRSGRDLHSKTKSCGTVSINLRAGGVSIRSTQARETLRRLTKRRQKYCWNWENRGNSPHRIDLTAEIQLGDYRGRYIVDLDFRKSRADRFDNDLGAGKASGAEVQQPVAAFGCLRAEEIDTVAR